MTKLIIDGDLIVGQMDGDAAGMPMPDEMRGLPHEQLRFDGETIVDAADVTSWWIDDAGVKHLAEDPDGTWQSLECAWDDPVMRVNDIWRVEADADRLEAMKAKRKAEVDTAGEMERLKYLTAGSGQAMTYAEKLKELDLFLVDPDPQDADYMFLSTEIGITGETLADVAASVQARRDGWKPIGAAIEGVRLGTKMAIDTAATMAELDAIVPVWPGA